MATSISLDSPFLCSAPSFVSLPPLDSRPFSVARAFSASASLHFDRPPDCGFQLHALKRAPLVSVNPLFLQNSASRYRKEQCIHVLKATTEQASSDQLQEMGEVDDDLCELVNRMELTVGEGEDAIDAYLVKAIKNNNGAAVLLLPDVYGFDDDDTRDFAYRLSCFGYNVLVPDLFRGLPWSDEIPWNEYEVWRAKHPTERISKDIDAASSYLLEAITTAGVTTKLGLLGFCFGGGRIIETLARDGGQQFAAAVTFYPTRFDAALANQIKVPVLLIAGDKDDLCAVDYIQNVAKQIGDSKAQIYPGRGHAFAHRPASPEEDEDAEDAFLSMKIWFHDKLLSHT